MVTPVIDGIIACWEIAAARVGRRNGSQIRVLPQQAVHFVHAERRAGVVQIARVARQRLQLLVSAGWDSAGACANDGRRCMVVWVQG